MSRKRRSKFDALPAEEGNRLRDEAMGMMHAASEAQQSLEQRRGNIAAQRNQHAAQEGMRQRDIRADHATPYMPTKSRRVGSAGHPGLHLGLLQQVAARRKTRPRPGTVFPVGR